MKKLSPSLHDFIKEKENNYEKAITKPLFKKKKTIMKKLLPSLYNSIEKKENNYKE
ncbi:31764_t:CDS:1, partial [Gigaspora margarita]